MLRTKVWFPGLEKLVEHVIDCCAACQVNHPRVNYEPLQMSTMPSGPWELIDIDFYGPTPDNTDLLVLIDQYSRFAIVEEVKSKTVSAIIPVLHKILSTFGIPVNLKSDNGPPFTSSEFEKMCVHFGIKHQLITPYWPRANGEVERFNRNINKVMRNAAAENTSWKKELNLFLGSYRATPHSSTGVPPAQLLFKFNATSRLTTLLNTRSFNRNLDDEIAVANDCVSKAKMKSYGDKHLHVRGSNFQIGDLVLFKQPNIRIKSKLKPIRENEIYRITAIKGSNVTAISMVTNQIVNRNSSCFKKFESSSFNMNFMNRNIEFDINCPPEQSDPNHVDEPANIENINDQIVIADPQPIRRSSRIGHRIERLQVNPRKKIY